MYIKHICYQGSQLILSTTICEVLWSILIVINHGNTGNKKSVDYTFLLILNQKISHQLSFFSTKKSNFKTRFRATNVLSRALGNAIMMAWMLAQNIEYGLPNIWDVHNKRKFVMDLWGLACQHSWNFIYPFWCFAFQPFMDKRIIYKVMHIRIPEAHLIH